jgi:hypothetical protein
MTTTRTVKLMLLGIGVLLVALNVPTTVGPVLTYWFLPAGRAATQSLYLVATLLTGVGLVLVLVGFLKRTT